MYTRLIQGYEAMDPELREASASAASKLRPMMCGSSALPYPVMQQWETITKHHLLERYGMTEFVMAISIPLRGIKKGSTVGKPVPGFPTAERSMEVPAWKRGLRFLQIKKQSFPAAIHSIVFLI